jgi:hypothetical protein
MGPTHAWFFSISSYRRRTQKRQVVGRLLERYGFDFVGRAVLLAFLHNNFLVERLDARRLARLAGHAGEAVARRLGGPERKLLGGALNGLMAMSPEFRYDTSRLFLSMFGRSRNVRRELSADPLDLLERQPAAAAVVPGLIRTLGGQPELVRGASRPGVGAVADRAAMTGSFSPNGDRVRAAGGWTR